MQFHCVHHNTVQARETDRKAMKWRSSHSAWYDAHSYAMQYFMMQCNFCMMHQSNAIWLHNAVPSQRDRGEQRSKEMANSALCPLLTVRALSLSTALHHCHHLHHSHHHHHHHSVVRAKGIDDNHYDSDSESIRTNMRKQNIDWSWDLLLEEWSVEDIDWEDMEEYEENVDLLWEWWIEERRGKVRAKLVGLFLHKALLTALSYLCLLLIGSSASFSNLYQMLFTFYLWDRVFCIGLEKCTAHELHSHENFSQFTKRRLLDHTQPGHALLDWTLLTTMMMTKTKTKTMTMTKTMTKTKTHPKRLVTFETLSTILTIENLNSWQSLWPDN